VYVLDATPLIYLAKAEALEVLDGFEVVTTLRVHDEVVIRGREAGAPDARRVERYGPSVVEAPENEIYERLSDVPGLSDADASVLALADEKDATAVMDEKRGRNVAEVESIDVRGTAYLLLVAVKNDERELSAEDAREILDTMVEAGWYCSTSFYAKTVRKIDELDDSR
jgi:predicted nucleic acid-binding protein